MTSTQIPTWVNDQITPMDKLEVHRRGLRHMAVSVFVFCEGQLLLQRRALEKYHTPGLWANTCCTHPHWGELPEVTALRRLRDELNLSVPQVAHKGRVEYRADVGGDMIEHEVVDMFVGALPSQSIPEPNPQEVMQTRWITRAQLEQELADTPHTFTPWLAIYMAEHADMVWPA